MSTGGDPAVSLDAFKQMAEQAGLGLSQQEVEELKPLYDLHYEYVKQLHSLDLQAEEIAMAFHPDWPS